MRKLDKALKTLLILSAFLLGVGCDKGPAFPEIHPKGIKPSADKAWPCEITDKENMKFSCSKTSIPLKEAELDGGYAVSAKDMKAMIRFGKDTKAYFKDHCE